MGTPCGARWGQTPDGAWLGTIWGLVFVRQGETLGKKRLPLYDFRLFRLSWDDTWSLVRTISNITNNITNGLANITNSLTNSLANITNS